MTVPFESPSGSVLAAALYVVPALLMLVTVNVTEFVVVRIWTLVIEHSPEAFVTQFPFPLAPLLQVPLTVAPETAAPF